MIIDDRGSDLSSSVDDHDGKVQTNAVESLNKSYVSSVVNAQKDS